MSKILSVVAVGLCACAAFVYTEQEARDKYDAAMARRAEVVTAKDATLTSYTAAEAAYTFQAKRFADNSEYLYAVMPMMDYNMVQWHLYLADQEGSTGDYEYGKAIEYWARGDGSIAKADFEMLDPLGTDWNSVYQHAQDANSDFLIAQYFFSEAAASYGKCVTHAYYADTIMDKYVP